MEKQGMWALVIIGIIVLLVVTGMFVQKSYGVFSIIGDARRCGTAGFPHNTLYPDGSFNYDCSDANCPSGACLINTYINDVPMMEYKNSATGSADMVEIYCCPHPECQLDSDCEEWYGGGSKCEISYAKDDDIDYEFNSWKACTSQDQIICWYKEEGVCKDRTYFLNSCPYSYKTLKLHSSKSVCEEAVNGDGNGVECKGKEDIFYSNVEGIYSDGGWVINIKKTITPELIDRQIAGFSNKYFENKAIACCGDLDYVYVDSVSKEIIPLSFLWGLLGQEKFDFSYDVYKCVPEGGAGICLEFAQRWLGDITKSDNCQTNTILFIILIIGGGFVIKLATGR